MSTSKEPSVARRSQNDSRTSHVLPLDVIMRICEHLSDDIRYHPESSESARPTLARMMHMSHAIWDIAGRALYRTLVIKNSNFTDVIRGLQIKETKGTWPNKASHARKLRLLGFARHLDLAGLPRGTTCTQLMQTLISAPLFGRVQTMAISDSFAMCVARYAIVKSTTPEGDAHVPPHPFFDFVRTHVQPPESVCISYPMWEDRDNWIDSFDIEAIHAWINLEDFNNAEPSDYEMLFWGRIQLRRHYLAMMRRQKEQLFMTDLVAHWKPTTITLHNFDFAWADNPPNLPCRTLRIFSCQEMCDQHPNGLYSHRQLMHSGDCLANRGSYWYKARDLLRKLAALPTKPEVVEMCNVGTTFLLACPCQNRFNEAVQGCKDILHSLDKLVVETPHWSQVRPCRCCGQSTPRGQDTLDTPDEDPAGCKDPHTWEIAVRLSNTRISMMEDRESADYYEEYDQPEPISPHSTSLYQLPEA